MAPQSLWLWRGRRYVVPCRAADAHAAQPQAPAGSLHHRRCGLPAARLASADVRTRRPAGRARSPPATHALAKALLFVCLSAPEAAGELEGEPVALAARYPVSAFGFLFGMLAMLGVPPLLGFLGPLETLRTALQIHLAAGRDLHPVFDPGAGRLCAGADPQLVGTADEADSPDRERKGAVPAPGHDRGAGGRAARCRRLAAAACKCSKGVADETLESIDVLLPPPQPVALPYELGKLQRVRHRTGREPDSRATTPSSWACASKAARGTPTFSASPAR